MGLGNNLCFKFKTILYYLWWEGCNFFNYTRGLSLPGFLSGIKGSSQERGEGMNPPQLLNNV